MSEPMTTVEIEDVLASIRRLVSEDLRAAASRSAEAPRNAATQPDKLLLTPSLRVAPTADPVEGAADLVHPAADSLADGPSIGSVVARVGAQVREDVTAEDWGAEAPYQETGWDDDAGWEDVASAPAGLASPAAGQESSVVPFVLMQERRLQAAWRDGAWADTADRGAPTVTSLPAAESRMAEPESNPRVTVDEFLDASRRSAEQGEEGRVDLGSVAIEPVPAEIIEAVDDTVIEAPDRVEDRLEDMTFDAAVTDEPAEAEATEDDLVETAVIAGMAEAEDEVMARVVGEVPRIFAPGDADEFDEEALREVVRDIMREELQGALGERITRSVRKLVRAEIQRMLIARDLS